MGGSAASSVERQRWTSAAGFCGSKNAADNRCEYALIQHCLYCGETVGIGIGIGVDSRVGGGGSDSGVGIDIRTDAHGHPSIAAR